MYRYNLYKIQNASRYDSQRHALYHLKQYEILKMTTQYLLKIGMFTSSLERPPNSTGKLFRRVFMFLPIWFKNPVYNIPTRWLSSVCLINHTVELSTLWSILLGNLDPETSHRSSSHCSAWSWWLFGLKSQKNLDLNLVLAVWDLWHNLSISVSFNL